MVKFCNKTCLSCPEEVVGRKQMELKLLCMILWARISLLGKGNLYILLPLISRRLPIVACPARRCFLCLAVVYTAF